MNIAMILVLSSDWGQGLPQEHLEHLSWPPVSTLEVFLNVVHYIILVLL